MFYAQLKNSIVIGVSQVSGAIESPDLIKISGLDSSLIGCSYVNGAFIAPQAVTGVILPWSKKDFLLKFTPAEYGSIKAAAAVNHDVDYYWTLLSFSGEVIKTNPVTIAGINLMEAAGLLAAGRAAEILA